MRRTAAGLLVVVAATLLAPQAASATSGRHDPPLTVDQATLDAALQCSTPFDDTREPVLLVHGTFASYDDNYGWNYRPHLLREGFDVCGVTLPNRSLDDIQVSSEYVVNAVRRMSAMADDRQIDILGHSQGGLQPRWVTRWYPETRALIDDVVTLAAPHHGTTVASLQAASCEACYQMSPSSDFIARLNAGDETPGVVDYTSIYSQFADELVQPQPRASTLLGGGPNVANLSIQVVCAPTFKAVDHVTIVADQAVYDLVLDALTRDGPANAARAHPDCTTPFFVTPEDILDGQGALEDEVTGQHVPSASLVPGEPAIAWYADPGRPAFADVPIDHWAYWEIEWAAANGIATAEPSGFGPDRPWTRAQATMWLWHLAGDPAGAPVRDFSDVPDDAWYHDGLDWAAAEGIVRGFSDGSFRPRGDVTRAQLASWLWTFAGQPAGAPHHAYTDVPAGAWYHDGLDWVAAEGIVAGFPGNRFEPSRTTVRGNVADMLFRLARVTG